jgi:hypothetical protein
VDTTTLKVDSTNNRVGIGVASPDVLLDVGDSDHGSAGNVGIQIQNSQAFATVYDDTNSNNFAGIQTVNHDDTSNRTSTGLTFVHRSSSSGIAAILSTSAASDRADIRFITRGSGGISEKMIINDDGRVGIGTNAPKSTLNIAANNSGQGPILTIENTDTSITTNDVLGQIDFYGNDGSTGGTGQKATIKAIAENGSGTSVGLSFGTSPFPTTAATERMRLDASGKLIFYNSDGDAAGGIRGTRFGYSTAYRVLQLSETSSTYSVAIGVDPSTNASGSFTGYGNELIVRNDFELISPNAANDNWHNDIIKLKDGNVGIGMSPDGASSSTMEKFQVMGRAVIHNSNGNTVWSETIQGIARGSLHLDPHSGSNDVGAAITWGASDHNNGESADAGIYTRSDGTYGTKMYISTTDSYSHGSQTAIAIMSDGQVYQPRQSTFLAYGSASGYNPSGSYGAVVVYPTAGLNIGNDYNTSNGLYTAPWDGFYIFEGSCYFNSTATNGWAQAWLAVNGGRANFTDQYGGTTAPGQSIISSIHTIYLTSGDTVGYHPYTSSGTSYTTYSNVHHTWFRGRFIG